MGKQGMIALVFVCLLSGTASAQNALLDYLGPQEISMGEASRADARGQSSTTLNPAGLSLNQQLVFMGSYGFRAEDNASLISAAACDSTVVVPGCFHYNYFTAEPEVGGTTMNRSVHQFGVTAARAITPSILLGANGKYFRYKSDLAGQEDVNGFAFDFGLIVRMGDIVNIAGVAYNFVATDTPQYPRAVATGVTVRPAEPFALHFDARWDVESDDDTMKGMRFGGGAQYFFSTGDRPQWGLPLRLGVVRDNGLEATYVTGGVGYHAMRVGIDVGIRHQVSNGEETIIQAGLALFGPGI
jgi:hypothetical protein